MKTPVVSHDQKSHIKPHLNHLDVRNAVVPLATLLALCDAYTSFSCDFDQKVILPFMSLVIGLRHAVVPLIMPFASYDTDTNTNGIMWPKCHIAPHFSCLNLMNAIADTIGNMWHWCQCHWCQITKKSCCIWFLLSWPTKFNGATENTIGITWCQCWSQWCHMIKTVMLHPILIILI